MRKRYRVLLFAAVAAALVVPVGFALSLDSSGRTAPSAFLAGDIAQPAIASTLVLTPARTPFRLTDVPDGARLLFVGTVLFGLAAAIRRRAK